MASVKGQLEAAVEMQMLGDLSGEVGKSGTPFSLHSLDVRGERIFFFQGQGALQILGSSKFGPHTVAAPGRAYDQEGPHIYIYIYLFIYLFMYIHTIIMELAPPRIY